MSGSQPDEGHGFGGSFGFDEALRELGEALATHPQAAQAVWMRFASDCMSAGAATMAHALGAEGGDAVVTPARTDRRFKDPSWQQNPVYFGLAAGLSALVAVHARPGRCSRSRPRRPRARRTSPSTR